MRARETAEQFQQWAVGGFEKYAGKTRRQRHAYGIAIACGVFHGDEAGLTRYPYADGAPGGSEFVD
jgi:hypothetical protein